jgi:hypothetical protein
VRLPESRKAWKKPHLLVELHRKDAATVAADESETPQLHKLELGELGRLLGSVQPELVRFMMRVGFRIDEGRLEFPCRLGVDEAKRQSDHLKKRAVEKGDEESRRRTERADRQWRFEHAFEAWHEALKSLVAGNGEEAFAFLNEALAWTAYKETSAARAKREAAAVAAKTQRRPLRADQQELVNQLKGLEKQGRSSKVAKAVLCRRLAEREGISIEAARSRLRRACNAAQKKTVG